MDTDLTPSGPLATWLRWRVLALRASTPRRIFVPVVELVSPAPSPSSPPLASWEHAMEPTDYALRVDILVRLLTTQPGPVALVHARPGRHEPTDADVEWAAAARVAGAITGVDVAAAIALSRWGWRDLTTGAGKTWKRPRAA